MNQEASKSDDTPTARKIIAERIAETRRSLAGLEALHDALPADLSAPADLALRKFMSGSYNSTAYFD